MFYSRSTWLKMTILHMITCLLFKSCWVNLPQPSSDQYLDSTDSIPSSWRTEQNYPHETSMTFLRGLQGTLIDKQYLEKMETIRHELDDTLPEHFDAREKWKNCPSLSEVRDQGSCGSCWAHASTEVMTDRVCIHSNGTKNFHFSAIDLVWCGDAGSCEGGYPHLAFDYWVHSGIVSDGNYDSKEKGCKPYPFKKCNHHSAPPNVLVECNYTYYDKPCNKICESKDLDYQKDLRFGKSTYKVLGDEKQIMQEIFKNGPVTSIFDIYNDFLNYKSGIYRHVGSDVSIGAHVVKIIGWGVENGTKYWLITNSWNELWGENGFFRIVRGEDHCSIESIIVTGLPLL